MKKIIRLWLLVFTVSMVILLSIGCTYTHPSIAEPDLIEKITNGHVICYYKTGPGRGYAKCCDDCPMHGDSSAITTRAGR